MLQDFKVKQDSLFDLNEFYKQLWRWFELYDYNFAEQEYIDMEEPKGKHIELLWYADKKIDKYVKFVITVGFLILGIKEVEIEKGGVKVKTKKGSVEMRISAYLAKDYDDKWSDTPTKKGIRLLYERYIARKRLDIYGGKLEKEAYVLLNDIRSFLAMHNF